MDNLIRGIQVNRIIGAFFKSLIWRPEPNLRPSDGNDAQAFVDAINAAKQDLDNVEKLFNSTADPDLIEYAIYEEYAARLKLSYLIKKAKEKDIKRVDYVPF